MVAALATDVVSTAISILLLPVRLAPTVTGPHSDKTNNAPIGAELLNYEHHSSSTLTEIRRLPLARHGR